MTRCPAPPNSIWAGYHPLRRSQYTIYSIYQRINTIYMPHDNHIPSLPRCPSFISSPYKGITLQEKQTHFLLSISYSLPHHTCIGQLGGTPAPLKPDTPALPQNAAKRVYPSFYYPISTNGFSSVLQNPSITSPVCTS